MRDWLQRQSALLLVTGLSVLTLGLYMLKRTPRQIPCLDDDVPEYSYKSFEAASQEIRLLLLPDRRTARDTHKKTYHSYQLRIFSMGSAPPFEAISYTWGSGPHNEIIRVHDQECDDSEFSLSFKTLQVSRKVRHILHSRDISRRKGGRWLWIDSVCINQKDDNEKSLQVPQMGDIYHRASKVIICLDDPLEKSPLQFELITDLLKLWLERKASSHSTDTLVGTRYSWRKLAQFLSHPYWARVWIIQEISIPQHLYILAEGKLITWETFMSLWGSIHRGPGDYKMLKMLRLADLSVPEIDRISLSIRQINDIIELRTLYQSVKTDDPLVQIPAGLDLPPERLHKLLYDSRKFLCKDPRDKVFGLFGLLGSSEDLRQGIPNDIFPNYDISAEELFTRVASWFCLSGLYASQLVRAGIGYPRMLSDLPTWVPDRTSSPAVYLEETIYSAGGTTDKPLLDVQRPHNAPARLRVTEAYRVGILSEILLRPLTMDANGPTKFVLDAVALVERQFPDHIDSLIMPQSEEHAYPEDDTLWRTLLMDCDLTIFSQWYSPAPQSLGEGFALLYEAAKTDSLFHKRATKIVKAEQFLGSLSNSNERTFGVTESFGMAMVPPFSRAGDELFVIRGIRVPMLLRRIDDDVECAWRPRYQLVGDAYFHGMMKEEALSLEPCELMLV
jgi:hypothetical protein